VRITVDTNILVRGAIRDDGVQALAVDRLLKSASLIAVPLTCLCEFVWVLRRVYRLGQADIASAIRALLATANVATNRPAVEAGLVLLDAGGDFADGVIAHQGRWLGGEVFVSFDRKAVKLLADAGQKAELLG
jgi:predicted nucleic-acid-binding protein